VGRAPSLRATLVAATLTVTACVSVPADPQLRTWGDGSPAFESCELTAVSWNIHKRSGPRFEAELASHTQGADLVLLQESTEPGSQDALPSFRVQVVAFARRRDGRPTGVATAATARPRHVAGGWTADREPWTRTPKSALIAWFDLPSGPPLAVVNLHGINFRRSTALQRQLADIEARLTKHAGPLLVAGDFNTWSRARREVVVDMARRLALEPAFADSAALRLDGAFARGLEVLRAEVQRSRVSDHDALRVRFRVETCSSGVT
jgi:endonuclease/exonuclease/phosphatase (EEP) superfamily protein YafD